MLKYRRKCPICNSDYSIKDKYICFCKGCSYRNYTDSDVFWEEIIIEDIGYYVLNNFNKKNNEKSCTIYKSKYKNISSLDSKIVINNFCLNFSFGKNDIKKKIKQFITFA
jgi:hypothetical protein